MGYFKISSETQNSNWPSNKRFSNEIYNAPVPEDDFIQQRQRVNVMGAILNQIDNKNFMTTVAIVDKYGKYLESKEFTHQLPKDHFQRYEKDQADNREHEER